MTPPGRPRPTSEDDARAFLARALSRARRVLLWEQVWPSVVALAAVGAAFLAFSFAGLWEHVPVAARIVGVLVFLALLMLAARPLFALHAPTRGEALARLDAASALAHRPATALADQLATRPDDPVGLALWRAHFARARAVAHRLRPGLPHPGVAARDPYALRALVLLALFAAFFMAPGAHLARIGAAFDWRRLTPAAPYRLDAWVDPPRYTGRPPVVLPGLRSDDDTSLNAAALQVPAGSVLVVRGAGLDPQALTLDGAIVPQPAPAGESEPREHRYTIAGDADVSFQGPDAHRLMWHFKAMADLPPTIAFARPPGPDARNALRLSYRVEDDYGVTQAEAHFTPTPPEAPLFPRPGSRPQPLAPRPLVAPPDFKLTLPPGGRAGAAQTTKDLTAHPWAGALVHLTLTAEDAAGHKVATESRIVRLPERRFTKPLARALIDERRRLAFDARNRRRLVAVLAALTTAPDQFMPPAGEYLGLRTALARAKYARNDNDLRDLVDYLWEVAVEIEDGTLSDAERALKDAQQALKDALERGADDAEIRRLTEELRAAMEQMMRQLAAEAERNPARDQPLSQNTRIVRPQDLQRMLDRIEDLARSGNREAAQRLLEELQAMMENMRPGSPQAGGQSGQGQQQSELGAMIQEQQRLRDRTYRQQRQRGQPGEGQSGGEGQNDFGALRQGQQQLGERLGRMRDALRQLQQAPFPGPNGTPQDQDGAKAEHEALGRAGESLGEAADAMRAAEQALGRGDGQGALEAEGRALQSLRRGAQALAEGQRNGPGGGARAGDGQQRTDPLGRPLRAQDFGDDYTVKVPDEVDAQRARRVLEELRRRLEEPSRPKIELDYLERLLNGL